MEIKDKARNEAVKLPEEKLEDLSVVEDQAEETKGGEGRTRLIFGDDHGLYVAGS